MMMVYNDTKNKQIIIEIQIDCVGILTLSIRNEFWYTVRQSNSYVLWRISSSFSMSKWVAEAAEEKTLQVSPAKWTKQINSIILLAVIIPETLPFPTPHLSRGI